MSSFGTDQQTILFLAANPKDTGRLRLDQELRDIAEGLQRAQKRDQFNLEQRLAVRPRDIQRAMLDVNPHIIHFSGHGSEEQGLIFEDEIGSTKVVDGTALAGLFELFADQVACVVLNGCYSEEQAQAIAQHIPWVIGMKQAIGNRAAIAFAIGFYDALGAGRSIEFAYKLGCSAIRMDGITEYLTPVLLKQATTGSATIQSKPKSSGSIRPGLDEVEKICAEVISPQQTSRVSPQAFIEYYLQTDSNELEPADIRKIEQALQSDTLDASMLAQGCRLLRKEKGLDLVINQLDWIYELAFIADGAKPRYFLPAPKPTGRLASTAWMEALLKQGLPGDYSCSVALTLGSFGVFIPEMVPPLQFLFSHAKYASESRDAALIYLSLMGSSEAITMLVQAADTPESGDDYLCSRGLFGLLLIDNVNLLAGQLRKALPYADLSAYAFGLAGSRDPQGRVLLGTMKNHPNERVRTAIENAFNSRWISAPKNASSIVAAEAQGLLAKHQIHQIQSALNLMESSCVSDWKLCFLTFNQYSILEDILIKALSLGDQVAQRKAIKAICRLMGTNIQEWKSGSELTLGKRSPLWRGRLSPEKVQEIEKFLKGQNLDPQTLAEGCLLLTKEQGINPVNSQADWIYEIAIVADGAKPRRHLVTPKTTGRLASVDWMKKLLGNGFPQESSCWVAQTLGALGFFIPEMIRPLTFLFTNPKYTKAERDEALIYLAMLDMLQVAQVLVTAADSKDDYYSSQGLLGLLLLDNVDTLAEQLLKIPPYGHMTAYAYGLAGSRDPRGQTLLQQMRKHSNKNLRKAVEAALAASWNRT